MDILTRQKLIHFIADVDVYVSLHRSEGFGLVMAEAMYVGTPVIATSVVWQYRIYERAIQPAWLATT